MLKELKKKSKLNKKNLLNENDGDQDPASSEQSYTSRSIQDL
jgi:hypothetical protein